MSANATPSLAGDEVNERGDNPSRSGPEVVQVDGRHAAAVAAFFRKVWSPDATAEAVNAARVANTNPAASGAEVPSFAFLLEGNVVGYIGTIPTYFHRAGGVTSAHWLKGFMVLPEHRNGPIGYLVLKEATRRLGVAAALTVADPSRRLFEALGYRNLGLLSNQILPLRPVRILQAVDVRGLGLDRQARWLPSVARAAQRTGASALAGAAWATALAVWHLVLRARSPGFTFHAGLDRASDDEIDALDARMRTEVSACAVRDAAHLRWRYPEASYTTILMREKGALVGIAVIRLPRAQSDERLRGIRVATLSDVCFPPGRADIGTGLMVAAARAARRVGADALLGSASHPALKRALRRTGSVSYPPNVHFLLRDAAGTNTLSEWWLTRGDANSDEVF